MRGASRVASEAQAVASARALVAVINVVNTLDLPHGAAGDTQQTRDTITTKNKHGSTPFCTS